MDMRLGFVAILWNEPRRAAFEACLFDNAKLAIVFHLAKPHIVVKYAHPFRVESSPAVCGLGLGLLKRSPRYHGDDVEAMVRSSLVSRR